MLPRPPAPRPKAMTVVHESSFIKAFDDFFVKTLAAEYEKLTGIKIVYEAVSVGGMLTRLTTIAETKSGPEIAMTGLNWPHLFDKSLVDVSDVAGEIGKKLGGWHENVRDVVVVNKKWKALPWGNIGQLEVYRTDWFKEVGVTKFPETWEDLLAAGRLLKKKGHPFGFELGHGFGDNHGWLYPLLWSYGGREVDKDGKTVLIDSSETAAAVDFCRRFYKETMFEDVLGWTDVNNNKAFFGEQISCTNNASSILVVAKRDFPEIAKVTDHALNPQGPKGRFHVLNARVARAAWPTRRTRPAAKAFLRGSTTTSRSRAGSRPATRTTRRSCTATTTTRCGTPSRATCRTRSRSRPRVRTAGPGPVGQRGLGERGQVRARRHVRQGVPRRLHEGRHRDRGRPAQADLQSEVVDGGRSRRPSPGRRPLAGRAARPAASPRARGRLQLADAGAGRPVPARVRRLSVLLRDLPEPAGPAGGRAPAPSWGSRTSPR